MSHKACGIEQRLLDEIVRIITAHKKTQRIVLFGSRATGSFGEGWKEHHFSLLEEFHFKIQELIKGIE